MCVLRELHGTNVECEIIFKLYDIVGSRLWTLAVPGYDAWGTRGHVALAICLAEAVPMVLHCSFVGVILASAVGLAMLALGAINTVIAGTNHWDALGALWLAHTSELAVFGFTCGFAYELSKNLPLGYDVIAVPTVIVVVLSIFWQDPAALLLLPPALGVAHVVDQ